MAETMLSTNEIAQALVEYVRKYQRVPEKAAIGADGVAVYIDSFRNTVHATIRFTVPDAPQPTEPKEPK